MKYLYILTSDDSDFYLEQAMLSMYSLRLQMPNAFISLLVDETTEIGLKGKRSEIINFTNELISINIDHRYNKKACSRWLKTSMRQHLTGDFLYIDGDTIITDDLSELDTMDINLGAVLNEHTKLSSLSKYNPAYFKKMQDLDKRLSFVSTIKSDTYFNGGLLLCKDCTIGHNFFKEWHELWLYCFEQGIITDQQSYNQSNYILGNIITELDGKWNCQFLSDGGIRYFHDAKIIHYFTAMQGDNPYLLANHNIIEHIKKTGVINQELKNMLANPKSLFTLNSRLRTADKFNSSAIYAASKRVFNSKFGYIIESIFSFIQRKIFSPLRKQLIR